MSQPPHARAALGMLVAAMTLVAGCGSSHSSPPGGPAISSPIGSNPSSSSAVPPPSRGGRGGNNPSTAVGLPADWPQDLPIPQGTLVGATGSNGRWTVLILAPGSAADVRRSAVAFYTASGFKAVADSVLDKGNRQITLVAENRDHSATATNLVIQVTPI